MWLNQQLPTIVALGVLALHAPMTQSQEFPARPIRLIVPTTPGGLGDTLPRILAPGMAKILGQPIVVENKPGANQMIGYEYVAKQVPADGYTIAGVTVPNLVILPAVTKDMRFDPVKDLPPFIGFAEARLLLASANQMPWKTFGEMVAYARANPGKLNFGSASSIQSLQLEALARELKLPAVHVPYSTTGAMVTGVAAGEVHFGFMSESTYTPLASRVKPITMTGRQRLSAFPDIPTFTEFGHPQIRGVNYSLNAPAGVPKAVIEKLHAAASRALKEPDVRARFAKAKVEIVEQGAEAAEKSHSEEARFFADVAAKIGLKPE